MSVRLNIASTYKVEYGNNSYFRNSQEFVESIITSLEEVIGKTILFNNSLNMDGCGTWEFGRQYIDNFIEYVESNKNDMLIKIKNIKNECFGMEDDVDEDLYDELLSFLKGLKNESDQQHDFIIVSWF